LSCKCTESLGDVISTEIVAEQRWVLTPEGEEVASQGSHEARLFNLVPAAGIPQVGQLLELKSWGVDISEDSHLC
jgi:phenylalanyl-tRNA synthetase alpha chain